MPESPQAHAFDNQQYFHEQMDSFTSRIATDVPNIVEFGGKPFGDYHAARVLPGYDHDIKADIIKCLKDELGQTKLLFAINARDLLARPDGRRIARRIRGDSQLTYDDEVLRIAEQADSQFGLQVSDVALTVLPGDLSGENQEYIDRYKARLHGYFDTVHSLPMIQGYPNNIPDMSVVGELTKANPIIDDENLIIMSPGGGSGKFSVAVTEIAHALRRGVVPNFIKFETFPVFNLPPDHPLNLAFLAATADLPNHLQTLRNGQTNYDKDIQNLKLLKQLLGRFPNLETGGLAFGEPTEMGVNVIDRSVKDHEVVAQACQQEIQRRIERYTQEISDGNETDATLSRVFGYIGARATA